MSSIKLVSLINQNDPSLWKQNQRASKWIKWVATYIKTYWHWNDCTKIKADKSNIHQAWVEFLAKSWKLISSFHSRLAAVAQIIKLV